MSWMAPPDPMPTRVQKQMVSHITFDAGDAKSEQPLPGRKMKPGANTSSSIVFMSDNDMKDYVAQRSAEHAELATRHNTEHKRKDEGVVISPGGDLDANGELIRKMPPPGVHISAQKPKDQFHITADPPSSEEVGLHTSISVSKKGQESHVIPSNNSASYDEFRQRAIEQAGMDRPGKSSDALSNPNYGYDMNYGFNQAGFKPTSTSPPEVERPPREIARRAHEANYRTDSSNFY